MTGGRALWPRPAFPYGGGEPVEGFDFALHLCLCFAIVYPTPRPNLTSRSGTIGARFSRTGGIGHIVMAAEYSSVQIPDNMGIGLISTNNMGPSLKFSNEVRDMTTHLAAFQQRR